MNILFLCHRIPFPPNKGDKIRSFNEIRHLSKRHNIYLGTILDQKSDKAYVSVLEQHCKEVYTVYFNKMRKLLKSLFFRKSFSVSNFYDKNLQNFVDETLRDKHIDAVICFCSSMAEYVFESFLYKENRLAGVKLIMDYVDLDSDKWLQYSRYSGFLLSLIYKIENKRLFKYEVEINQSFHHSVFVARREASLLKKLYPKAKNVWIFSNGVDYEYFSARQTPDMQHPSPDTREPVLVFTGVMDYFANEDGVKWFCQKIFPKIRAEFNHAQFYIVGSRPTHTVQKLAKIDGVTVTGYVDDIRTYYWMADVCVIPLRIACGLQNKVLEAMAAGNAVVTTSNAKGSIVCRENDDIMIADDEEKFAEEVICLLGDENRRKKMGRKAAENISQNYFWEKNLQGFEDLLQG